jgi:hypothetical protein
MRDIKNLLIHKSINLLVFCLLIDALQDLFYKVDIPIFMVFELFQMNHLDFEFLVLGFSSKFRLHSL